jgi:Rad3-related DNA helicase
MDMKDLIEKSVKRITIIEEINHPVSEWEIQRLKTINDVLMHSASILSDVQEMLNANRPKEEINSEINEAKWFIFKAIQYMLENPECPFKQVCRYYKKTVKTHYWSDKG